MTAFSWRRKIIRHFSSCFWFASTRSMRRVKWSIFLLARSTESFKENTRDPVNAPQPGEGLCRHRDAEIIRFRHFYITDPPGSDHNTPGAIILLCHGVGSRD